MKTKRRGHFIQTYTGGRFFPFDPHVEEVSLIDIAWALSNLCRFTGHSQKFISVGYHSILVSMYTGELHDLMHDASEAYTNDISKPVKLSLEELYGIPISEIETNIQKVIFSALDIPWPSKNDQVITHVADTDSLSHEALNFMQPLVPEWSKIGIKTGDKFSVILPPRRSSVFKLFLKTFVELGGNPCHTKLPKAKKLSSGTPKKALL